MRGLKWQRPPQVAIGIVLAYIAVNLSISQRAYSAVRRSPVLQKFLKWSILPQARVERSRCSANVTIGDARYGRGGRSRLGRELTIRTC